MQGCAKGHPRLTDEAQLLKCRYDLGGSSSLIHIYNSRGRLRQQSRHLQLLRKGCSLLEPSSSRDMPPVRTARNRKPPPDGFEDIEDTLLEFSNKMKDAENAPHEGKKRHEVLWPVFQINHQRKWIFKAAATLGMGRLKLTLPSARVAIYLRSLL